MSNYPEVEQYAKLYASNNSHISYEVLTDPTTRTDLQSEIWTWNYSNKFNYS